MVYYIIIDMNKDSFIFNIYIVIFSKMYLNVFTITMMID